MEPLYTFTFDHDVYCIYPSDKSRIQNLCQIDTKLREDFIDFMKTLDESSNYKSFCKKIEISNNLDYNYIKALKIHMILNNGKIDSLILAKLMKKYINIIYKIKYIYDLVINRNIPVFTSNDQRVGDENILLFIQHQFDCIMIIYDDIISNFSP